MYSQKVVLVIKSKGKVLQEIGDTVYLPFGSEYSILIKNLSSQRLAAGVSIDGIDATDDVMLVVEPNSEVELERYIKNANLKKGNRFKFIERTADIVQHRGVGPQDGLVKLTYQFEIPSKPAWPTISSSYYVGRNAASGSAGPSGPTGARGPMGYYAQNMSAPVASNGITAPGSVSEQEFEATAELNLDRIVHTMILQLKGEHVGKVVTAPVVTRTSITCTMCAKKSRSPAKFCSNCGAGLEIIN